MATTSVSFASALKRKFASTRFNFNFNPWATAVATPSEDEPGNGDAGSGDSSGYGGASPSPRPSKRRRIGDDLGVATNDRGAGEDGSRTPDSTSDAGGEECSSALGDDDARGGTGLKDDCGAGDGSSVGVGNGRDAGGGVDDGGAVPRIRETSDLLRLLPPDVLLRCLSCLCRREDRFALQVSCQTFRRLSDAEPMRRDVDLGGGWAPRFGREEESLGLDGVGAGAGVGDGGDRMGEWGDQEDAEWDDDNDNDDDDDDDDRRRRRRVRFALAPNGPFAPAELFRRAAEAAPAAVPVPVPVPVPAPVPVHVPAAVEAEGVEGTGWTLARTGGILDESDEGASACRKLLPFAVAGNAGAVYMLGMILCYTHRNIPQGLSLLHHASSVLNHPPSSHVLALLLRDSRRALSDSYLLRAARAGYLPSWQERLTAAEMRARFGDLDASALSAYLDPPGLCRLLGRGYVGCERDVRDRQTSHCWNPRCGRWAFKASTSTGAGAGARARAVPPGNANDRLAAAANDRIAAADYDRLAEANDRLAVANFLEENAEGDGRVRRQGRQRGGRRRHRRRGRHPHPRMGIFERGAEAGRGRDDDEGNDDEGNDDAGNDDAGNDGAGNDDAGAEAEAGGRANDDGDGGEAGVGVAGGEAVGSEDEGNGGTREGGRGSGTGGQRRDSPAAGASRAAFSLEALLPPEAAPIPQSSPVPVLPTPTPCSSLSPGSFSEFRRALRCGRFFNAADASPATSCFEADAEAEAQAAAVIRISRMKMCSSCRRAKYCSKLCQVYDWRSGRHKTECQFL